MARNSFDRKLMAVTDQARRTEAVLKRQHRSDRSLAAALSGTFNGTLVELAETQAPVSFRTRTGDSIRGHVIRLGPDVVLVQPAGALKQIALSRIAIESIVEHGPGHDRHVEHIEGGPELAAILDRMSTEAERVGLTLSTGNKVMGTILRVGIDQVTLRLDGDGDTITVPLFSIDQVVMSI